MNVAVLMPTLPNRNEVRARAIESLYAQVYPADWTVTVYQDIDPKPTLGAKLNLMMEACTEEYIVLCDDDDWHSPARVQRQVEPLLNGYELTGTSTIYYQDGSQAWTYTGDGKWLGGMGFTRAAWSRLKFEDISKGPDTHWQHKLKPRAFDLKDPALFIATIHATNTCKKNCIGSRWTKADFKMVTELMK